ncbi:hypothetical protein ACFLVS_02490 [Chloroflexota bacterium]
MEPRQQFLPVPYALGLKPGATVEGSISGPIINVENNASDGGGLRSHATALSGINYGVEGVSHSPDGYGGYFASNAAGGSGLYALGGDNFAPDLMLGGTSSTDDDGRIRSDTAYPGSDIMILSNDEVWIELDEDGNDDGNFSVRKGATNNEVFKVNESGDVEYEGALIGAFPRPAYDSGWELINQNEEKTFTHDLGGDVDDYVVDMTFKSDNLDYGVNQLFYGGMFAFDPVNYFGAYWKVLTPTSIIVKRYANDGFCDQVRIRIWVYK